MCVIFVSEKERPTPDMVAKGFERNPAGGGVAWREGGVVKWQKGLKLPEMQDACRELPLPFIAHFRIPSCGGPSLTLCHPFPVTEDAELDLEGEINGYVLFHNGHWTAWKTTIIDSVFKGNVRLPDGRWSDSRAMAFLAARHGNAILELIDEKIAVISPDDIEIWGAANGGDHTWNQVNGIWVSNKHWDSKTTNYYTGYTGGTSSRKHASDDDDDIHQHRRGTGGASDAAEAFPVGTPAVQNGPHQPKTVEQSPAAVRTVGQVSVPGPEGTSPVALIKWVRSLNPPRSAVM